MHLCAAALWCVAFEVRAVVPILRIFDEARAREFYVGYLGCTVDWEHRFDGRGPLYMQASRGSLVLHLSEHHGDGSPGQIVYVAVTGVLELHAELRPRTTPTSTPASARAREMTRAEPASTCSIRSATACGSTSESTRASSDRNRWTPRSVGRQRPLPRAVPRSPIFSASRSSCWTPYGYDRAVAAGETLFAWAMRATRCSSSCRGGCSAMSSSSLPVPGGTGSERLISLTLPSGPTGAAAHCSPTTRSMIAFSASQDLPPREAIGTGREALGVQAL